MQNLYVFQSTLDNGSIAMPLVVKKLDGETWKECCERIAMQFKMDYECLEEYERLISQGKPEDEACWMALYEWDCVPWENDNGKKPS